MNSSGKLSYAFRKYPLLRALFLILFVGIVLASIFIVSYRTKPVPEIYSINPPVGSPGDVIIILGKNFGDERDMSYVEFSGSRLTASSYLSWSDNTIKLVLPSNVQDGLVVVGTKDMRSKPSLFANEVDIPIPVQEVEIQTKPVISEIEKVSGNSNGSNLAVGNVIKIKGSNFGENRGSSKILFTVDYENKIRNSEFTNEVILSENLVEVSEFDYGYIFWSDTEILVKIPDGAYNGECYVFADNGNERSEAKSITLNNRIGNKTYPKKKIYLMQYGADIEDIVCSENSSITLRFPIPYKTVFQPNVELIEVEPEPLLNDYQHNLIHQMTRIKTGQPKIEFSQTFVLPVYEINTNIQNEDRIPEDSTFDSNFQSEFLGSDSLIPENDEKIQELASAICAKEKNPYKKARLIYNYVIHTFEILNENRTDDSLPLEILETNQGDAYDFAIITTALLRAAGIPSVTDGGILVGQDLLTKPHWWCEFYIENFGWIPMDTALAAGLEYKEWENLNREEYYFGNLDSHHIIFSRGWNQLKPFSSGSKIVRHARSFALQSIWEESSEGMQKYSSYWSNPVIKGVY